MGIIFYPTIASNLGEDGPIGSTRLTRSGPVHVWKPQTEIIEWRLPATYLSLSMKTLVCNNAITQMQ